MTERFIVDDAGTLIDMETRDTFDYVSDVCGLLNELHEESQRKLKTKCIVNKQYEENQRLIKMLDNVANYMQKQHKDMPIDDFVEWWNGIATKGLDNGDVE